MSLRRRAFVGNFDLEWSFTAQRSAVRPAMLERLCRELACCWLAVAGPDDLIVTPGLWDAEFLPQLQNRIPWRLPQVVDSLRNAPADAEVVPWGWSATIVNAIESAGLVVPEHPAPEVVRLVNSRSFSFEIEQREHCELPGAAVVHSLAELEPVLRRLSPAGEIRRWVIKANWSNSARERLLGEGTKLTEANADWIRSRLERDGVVAIEPWGAIEREAGIQWDIRPGEPPTLLGIVPLLSAADGRYRGSEFSPEAATLAAWTEVVEVSRRAATQVRDAGYFGPLGIDACLYRNDDGTLAARPVQDINARWTMGRLALGWRRLGDKFGCWEFGEGVSTGPTLATSPAAVDGQAVRLGHRLVKRDRG